MRFSLGFLMRALYAPGGRVSRARAQLRAAAACGGGGAEPQEVKERREARFKRRSTPGALRPPCGSLMLRGKVESTIPY